MRYLFLMLIAMMSLTSKAYYDFNINGIYYIISEEEEEAVAVTSGGNKYFGNVVIPDSVIYNGIVYIIKHIDHSAFKHCNALTSIKIPATVTYIGAKAFYGCTNLRSIEIPNGTKAIGSHAFYNCSNLSLIRIPESVMSIGFEAFVGSSWYNQQPDSILHIDNCCLGYKGAPPIGELTISNDTRVISDGAFYKCRGITFVKFPNSLVSIGVCALGYCRELKSISIPTSVTTIGEEAFKGTGWYENQPNGILYLDNCCLGYKGEEPTGKLKIAYGTKYICENAFEDCTGLISVTIPSSVTSIGKNAFKGCDGLTSVNIPNSVTSIGARMFEDCTGLTSVNIPNSVTSIGAHAFEDCTGLTSVTIPNSVTSIGAHAFEDCTGLTSVTIPNSVTSIGAHAFEDCTGLTSVTIPNSVTSIGAHAFEDCTGLTSVTIPNSVTSIGKGAFFSCTGLTSVTIPSSVTSIGKNAFKGCDGLTSVNIDDLLAWCKIEFASYYSNPLSEANNLCMNGLQITDLQIPEEICRINSVAFAGGKYFSSLSIPRSVTSIGKGAFFSCTGLTSVTIPNSVTSIGAHAFEDCTGLTSVTIPNSVTSIGAHAFEDCTGLTSVNIPNSVTSIGAHAFEDCTGLTSVNIPNSVTSIGAHAFTCTGWYNNQPNGILYLDNCCLGYKGEEPTGKLNIANGTRLIGDRAFAGCSDIRSIYIPNSIETIGKEAFVKTGWYNKQPDGILYIGNCCLGYKGTKPTGKLRIADGIKTIGLSAFADCEDVTSVIVPHSVRFLKVGTFEKYKGLVTILPSKRDMEKIDILKIPGVNIQDKYSILISKNYSLDNVSNNKNKNKK